MEASYQSRDKQFKTPFDVKESSGEGVGRGHVETRRGIKGKPQSRTSQGTGDMLRVPWLGSCPVLPSCAVRLKSNEAVFHFSSEALSISIQAGQMEDLLLLVCPWSVPHALECWALAQGAPGALAGHFRGGTYLKKVGQWRMSDPQG